MNHGRCLNLELKYSTRVLQVAIYTIDIIQLNDSLNNWSSRSIHTDCELFPRYIRCSESYISPPWQGQLGEIANINLRYCSSGPGHNRYAAYQTFTAFQAVGYAACQAM